MKKQSVRIIQRAILITAFLWFAIAYSDSTALAQAELDFNRIFHEFLDEECRIHPAFASSLGNHEHDHE
ncbi:MAG: hypothetical protein ACK494_00850, partial [Planctomycetota bacterium]